MLYLSIIFVLLCVITVSPQVCIWSPRHSGLGASLENGNYGLNPLLDHVLCNLGQDAEYIFVPLGGISTIVGPLSTQPYGGIPTRIGSLLTQPYGGIPTLVGPLLTQSYGRIPTLVGSLLTWPYGGIPTLVGPLLTQSYGRIPTLVGSLLT